MSGFEKHLQFGQKLCEALGLDGKQVTSIKVICESDAIVRAEVVFDVQDEQTEPLLKVLKACKWEE